MSAVDTGTRTIAVHGGTHLEVLQDGAGEPLVLVCGTSQSQHLWAPILPPLTGRYRVTTYDHRGIGGSARGSGELSAASLAEDLNTLLAGLGIARAHVLGWSLGSVVAQELAIRHPDRVGSLVLAATWGRTSTYQQAVFTALRHPWRTGDRAAALTALGIAYSRELLASDAYATMGQQLEPLFPVGEQMATVVEQWDVDLAHDARDRLGAVTAPTLVVAGEQDLLTPPEEGRAVAELIPGARFELLTGPGSSHAALMERPGDFDEIVLGFLAEHPLPAGRRSAV
ncbi:alpha/beta fold hydrolase [Kineococcus esterisolvens]|uniref:alpha/beta fold hydrolase n=1 Tax=unclassified Kineococcus TaxID=2621656 RepID=UPI003D7D067F